MSTETREVLVPHDLTRGPVVSVRRMLVHSSIAELKQLGVYERYCSLIPSASLARINELIGPGFLPVQLALAHYETCDRLALTDEQIETIGEHSGDKMKDALLVAARSTTAEQSAERAPWPLIGAYSRMGRRLYEGGSSQYVKVGPKQLQVENAGNMLFALQYYRTAHVGFLRKAFGSLGVEVTEVKLSPYRRDTLQIDVRITWK
jgi:hypothetical protein